MSGEPDSAPNDKARAPSWTLWLPLALFAGFVVLFASGLLRPGSDEVRSALVGKSLPTFNLPAAIDGAEGLENSDLARGEPRLLNIFASWCVPCRIEAPQLEAMAKRGVPIDGIAIRDRPEDIEQFLANYGNPFQRIGADKVSAVQLSLGSSGVPETFVVDGKGVIQYQHIGPIMASDVETIMAELEAAR